MSREALDLRVYAFRCQVSDIRTELMQLHMFGEFPTDRRNHLSIAIEDVAQAEQSLDRLASLLTPPPQPDEKS